MKSFFEQTGGTYSEVDGYLIPDLALPVQVDEQPLGIWGQRHLRYIKEHKRVFYTNLLTNGRLSHYLAEVDAQSENMFFRLVTQMAKTEDITEELKSSDQMAWVGKMNNIKTCAKEIVLDQLIYR